jgi:hypothetical protein
MGPGSNTIEMISKQHGRAKQHLQPASRPLLLLNGLAEDNQGNTKTLWVSNRRYTTRGVSEVALRSKSEAILLPRVPEDSCWWPVF